MIKLETERLCLREYTQDDFDALYRVLSDAETMVHYEKPYDERGVHRWIDWSLENYQNHGFGWWAIILKETGEFIGDCGITMQPICGQLLPEIGYHIHKDYWRRGYGKEAASAVRDWGFENTDFPALYSYMTASNVASYSTAASVGMEYQKDFLEDNTPMKVYSITRRAWEEKYRKENG